MKMVINKADSALFWYLPEKYPLAFTEGNKIKFMFFKVNGLRGELYADGKDLVVALDAVREKRIEIFRLRVLFNKLMRHSIILTWHPKVITLFIDGEAATFIDPLTLGEDKIEG